MKTDREMLQEALRVLEAAEGPFCNDDTCNDQHLCARCALESDIRAHLEQNQPFPIQGEREFPTVPRSVPWSLVRPYEARAQRNHSQSLERLAQRGGLSIREMWCLLQDRPLFPDIDTVTVEQAHQYLLSRLELCPYCGCSQEKFEEQLRQALSDTSYWTPLPYPDITEPSTKEIHHRIHHIVIGSHLQVAERMGVKVPELEQMKKESEELAGEARAARTDL